MWFIKVTTQHQQKQYLKQKPMYLAPSFMENVSTFADNVSNLSNPRW